MAHRARTWRAAIALVATAGLGIAAGPVAAQSAEAELLFRDGLALLEQGKLAEACEALDGSNRIEPRAGTLLLLGDCRERNGQLASAWSAFTDAAARAKDPKKLELARTRAAALEPRLSRLTITVDPAHRVDGLTVTRNGTPVDPALWNRGVPVDGGRYALVARAPGHLAFTTEVTVPLEQGQLAVEVPALAPEPAAAPTLPDDLDDDAPAAAAPTGLTGRRKLALGVAAGGAMVLAGAVVLGVQARGLEDDAHALCPAIVCTEAPEGNDLLERARTRATLANLGYGLGAAAIGAGAILWLTGGRADADRGVALAPLVAPGGGGALVRGRF